MRKRSVFDLTDHLTGELAVLDSAEVLPLDRTAAALDVAVALLLRADGHVSRMMAIGGEHHEQRVGAAVALRDEIQSLHGRATALWGLASSRLVAAVEALGGGRPCVAWEAA